jgi:hypothetical protein
MEYQSLVRIDIALVSTFVLSDAIAADDEAATHTSV